MTAIGADAWAKLCAVSDPLNRALLTELSPIVVVAPHPDDETLGCGGLLATTASLGLDPRVVYLTDGSASHRGSRLWSKSRLVEARRREALTALKVLGVGDEHVFFMEWADSEPLEPLGVDYEASIGRLMTWLGAFNPGSLWGPRAGESHCDHQAATALADDVARRRPTGLRRFDYLVWGWEDDRLSRLQDDELGWRLPCDSLIDVRRRALASHKTQTTSLIDDAVDAFLIPEALAAVVERPDEVFIERR